MAEWMFVFLCPLSAQRPGDVASREAFRPGCVWSGLPLLRCGHWQRTGREASPVWSWKSWNQQGEITAKVRWLTIQFKLKAVTLFYLLIKNSTAETEQVESMVEIISPFFLILMSFPVCWRENMHCHFLYPRSSEYYSSGGSGLPWPPVTLSHSHPLRPALCRSESVVTPNWAVCWEFEITLCVSDFPFCPLSLLWPHSQR